MENHLQITNLTEKLQKTVFRFEKLYTQINERKGIGEYHKNLKKYLEEMNTSIAQYKSVSIKIGECVWKQSTLFNKAFEVLYNTLSAKKYGVFEYKQDEIHTINSETRKLTKEIQRSAVDCTNHKPYVCFLAGISHSLHWILKKDPININRVVSERETQVEYLKELTINPCYDNSCLANAELYRKWLKSISAFLDAFYNYIKAIYIVSIEYKRSKHTDDPLSDSIVSLLDSHVLKNILPKLLYQ